MDAAVPAGERTPLVPTADPDPRRWGVMLLIASLSASQVAGWALWPIIAPAVKPLYGWDKDNFAMLVGLPNLVVIVSCFFWASAVTRIGIRNAVILAAMLMAASGGIRLGAAASSYGGSMVIQGFAGFFNGLAASPTQFLAPIVAQEWFPPGQRATATALLTLAWPLGALTSSLLGPWLVPEGLENTQDGVVKIMTVLFGWSVLVLAGSLWCPPQPRAAPSLSTGERRHGGGLQDMWDAVTAQSMTIALLSGAPQGVFALLSSLFGVVLPELGFTEEDAGKIGACAAFGGLIPTLAAGLASDHLGGEMLKSIVAAIYFVAMVSSFAFARFAYEGPGAFLGAALSATLTGAACMASLPLFFEMALEVTFPLTAEYVSSMLIVMIAGVQAVGYMFPFEQLGSRWLLWLLPATLALCLLVLAPFQVVYRRSAADKGKAKGEDGEEA